MEENKNKNTMREEREGPEVQTIKTKIYNYQKEEYTDEKLIKNYKSKKN